MLYFIDAAGKIINEEGMRAVTIRRVSELAGYTSATLYNYFDDLNHLIFLAAMTYLNDYSKEVPQRIKGLADPREIYFAVADCFCKYAYERPDIYEILFFTNGNKRAEHYTEQYYDLFPERAPTGFDLASKAARLNNLKSRSTVYTELCAEQGYLTHRSAREFDAWAVMSFKYCLEEVKAGRMEKNAARERHVLCMRRLMNLYSLSDRRG
jgi:AcrR family transcriptional regulator